MIIDMFSPGVGGVSIIYKMLGTYTTCDNETPVRFIPLQESSDGCGTDYLLDPHYLRDARAPRGA